MWKYWYQLTQDQKIQARELDAEVRSDPTIYLYYVNSQSRKVTGYRPAIGFGDSEAK